MGLEEELIRVDVLSIDLSAEIVIRGGGYWEERGYSNPVGGEDPRAYYHSENVWVDEPRITEPDTKKRETARKQLQQIYEDSEWYSARYAAGRVLGDLRLDDLISLWVSEFGKRVNATKTIMREVDKGHYEEKYGGRCGSYYHSSSPEWVSNIVEESFDEPNEEARIKAINDSKMLLRLSKSSSIKELIKRAYDENESVNVRCIAGKALSYSSLRIWLHELFRKKK